MNDRDRFNPHDPQHLATALDAAGYTLASAFRAGDWRVSIRAHDGRSVYDGVTPGASLTVAVQRAARYFLPDAQAAAVRAALGGGL